MIRQTPLTVSDLIAELQSYDPFAEVGKAEITMQTATRSSKFSYSKRKWAEALKAQQQAAQA